MVQGCCFGDVLLRVWEKNGWEGKKQMRCTQQTITRLVLNLVDLFVGIPGVYYVF